MATEHQLWGVFVPAANGGEAIYAVCAANALDAAAMVGGLLDRDDLAPAEPLVDVLCDQYDGVALLSTA